LLLPRNPFDVHFYCGCPNNHFSSEALAFTSAVALGFLMTDSRTSESVSPASNKSQSIGVAGLAATVTRISNCLLTANSPRTDDGQSL